MLHTVFSFLPLIFLIWLMVKTNGMPSNKALPLSALFVYFITLIIFEYEPNLVHANVLQGLLVSWTPILIIGGAIFLFKTMEVTGSISIVKGWLNQVTDNDVAQLMIVGWAFPFLIEGASGFGTPAAIAAPILVGLGYKPVKVAILALIMNTVPVSFGAVGTPTWFGFSAIELSRAETYTIAFKSASIHSIVALFIVVIALLQLVDFNKIRQNFVYILLSVASTVLPYLLVSLYSYEFPSLIGGAVGLMASILLAKKKIGLANTNPSAGTATGEASFSSQQLIMATFPLWGTILLLSITRIPALGIKQLLVSENPIFTLPLGKLGDFALSDALVLSLDRIFHTPVTWSHKLLYVPSILPFVVVSLITFWISKTSIKEAKATLNATIQQMQKPVLALFGALVFVNLMMMGQETSAVNQIGRVLARLAGDHWSLFASYLGAVGSFFSGSATISNLTFAGIQNTIALETGLDKTTILALQSVGASFGNMVCINNIVAVSSVLSLSNKEGVILKSTALPMLLYGALAGIVAVVLF